MTDLMVAVSGASSAKSTDRQRPATIIPPLAPIRRGRRDQSSSTRTARGRYLNVDPKARMNANGLAISASPNVPTGPAVVQDPMDPKSSVLVSVNKRVDLLEYEYSRGRITEAAYRTGRQMQNTFERLQSVGGSAWSQGDRVDSTVAHELAVLKKVGQAHAANGLFDRMVRAVGMVGARRLRAHLVDNLSYADAAAERGQSGREAVTFAAKSFRQLLEDVADSFAAKGRE